MSPECKLCSTVPDIHLIIVHSYSDRHHHPQIQTIIKEIKKRPVKVENSCKLCERFPQIFLLRRRLKRDQ